MGLTEQQIERYSRQIILKQVGGVGQEKLLASKVLIVGAGGLGSPVALYLAAAGIGTIGIIDADRVDVTNLQRQIIHFTDDVEKEKVTSAEQKIQAINPDVSVKTYPTRATAANIREILRSYDFVVDGTDNFPTKFLINDACYFEKVPFSHAGILRFDGQMMTVLPGRTACSQAGILGPLAGAIGCLQATEVLKYLLGVGELLTDRMLVFDGLGLQFRQVKVSRNPGCRICGQRPSIKELADEEQAVCDLKASQQ